MAQRTLHWEPKQFAWKRDRKESAALYAAWAEEGWANQVAAGCVADSGPDYAWGFREGFADFCYYGGDGQPPAVPPRPYWNALNRAETQAAVDQWFAGFRHGVQAAREGGYRERAVIRTSFATELGEHSPSILDPGYPRDTPALAPHGSPGATPHDAAESLPSPEAEETLLLPDAMLPEAIPADDAPRPLAEPPEVAPTEPRPLAPPESLRDDRQASHRRTRDRTRGRLTFPNLGPEPVRAASYSPQAPQPSGEMRAMLRR